MLLWGQLHTDALRQVRAGANGRDGGARTAKRPTYKVGLVRREAREWLGAWNLSSLADDLSVVLSELVTNAIRYGDGYFAVRMSRLRLAENSRLHLEVWDGSTDLPYAQEAGTDAENGSGLRRGPG